MSNAVRRGLSASGTLAAVNDAVTMYPGSDTAYFKAAMLSASSLTGFTFVVEVQMSEGGPWFTQSMYPSNATALTKIAVSPTLTGVPANLWVIPAGTVKGIRIRCTGRTTGSAVMAIYPSLEHNA